MNKIKIKLHKLFFTNIINKFYLHYISFNVNTLIILTTYYLKFNFIISKYYLHIWHFIIFHN